LVGGAVPELPEVETIRRDLLPLVLHKRITNVQVMLPRMIRRHGSAKEVTERVVGLKVEKLERRGKSLLFYLDEEVLVIHLGMTGQVLFSTKEHPFEKDKYTHVVISFERKDELLFKDIRQFGQMYVAEKDALEKTLELGPEPLEKNFTPQTLGKILRASTKIKPLLMDQKRIAGIGNIYSDEILFEAKIHPLRPANSLSEKEVEKLHKAIQTILKDGIKYRGTSVDNYVDAMGRQGAYAKRHRVYRRAAEPCEVCGTIIKRITVGGRSAHFCPKEQV
jgi:formamidopyrimidine-DNA glycosylase